MIIRLIGYWKFFTGEVRKDEENKKKEIENNSKQENIEQPQVMDGPNYEIIDVFLEEIRVFLPLNTQHLLDWENNEDIDALREIHKNLHTLRGVGNICELPEIVETTKQLQLLITALIHKEIHNKEMANKFLTKGNDIIVILVTRLEKRQSLAFPTKYLNLLQQFFEKQGVATEE